MLLDILVHYW